MKSFYIFDIITFVFSVVPPNANSILTSFFSLLLFQQKPLPKTKAKNVAFTKITNYKKHKEIISTICYLHLPVPRHTYYYESVRG